MILLGSIDAQTSNRLPINTSKSACRHEDTLVYEDLRQREAYQVSVHIFYTIVP